MNEVCVDCVNLLVQGDEEREAILCGQGVMWNIMYEK